MRKAILITASVFLLTGCSLFKPAMSTELKARMNTVLEEGATLQAMIAQGVNFQDFSNQLAKTRGAYDLAKSDWPDDIAREARNAFDQAFEGWDLAHFMWNLKIGEKDPPTEPNINGYAAIFAYAGFRLKIENWENTEGDAIPEYRNKNRLPFENNISVLLTIASDHFADGQKLASEAMK